MVGPVVADQAIFDCGSWLTSRLASLSPGRPTAAGSRRSRYRCPPPRAQLVLCPSHRRSRRSVRDPPLGPPAAPCAHGSVRRAGRAVEPVRESPKPVERLTVHQRGARPECDTLRSHRRATRPHRLTCRRSLPLRCSTARPFAAQSRTTDGRIGGDPARGVPSDNQERVSDEAAVGCTRSGARTLSNRRHSAPTWTA